MRFHDGNTNGNYEDAGDNVLYYATDANWNVTALVDAATGNVVERYMYDAYGKVTILDGTSGGQTDWATDADQICDVANDVLFAGYRFDSETGLYATDRRIYHATLGRWLGRDSGYVDGMNLYQYCRSNPAGLTDPRGLCPGAGTTAPLLKDISLYLDPNARGAGGTDSGTHSGGMDLFLRPSHGEGDRTQGWLFGTSLTAGGQSLGRCGLGE